MRLVPCVGVEAVGRAYVDAATLSASSGPPGSPPSGSTARPGHWRRDQWCAYGCPTAGAMNEVTNLYPAHTILTIDAACPYSAPCVAVRAGSMTYQGYSLYSSGEHPSCPELPPNSGQLRQTFCYRVGSYYVYPEMNRPMMLVSRGAGVTRFAAGLRLAMTAQVLNAYSSGTTFYSLCQNCDGSYYDCSYPIPDDINSQWPLGVPWELGPAPTGDDVAAILAQTTQEIGALSFAVDLEYVPTDSELANLTDLQLGQWFDAHPWTGSFQANVADVPCEGRSGSYWTSYRVTLPGGSGELSRLWPAYKTSFGGYVPALNYTTRHLPLCGGGLQACCTNNPGQMDYHTEEPQRVWYGVTFRVGTTWGKHADCWY